MKLTVTGPHNNKLAAQDGSVIADVFHDGLDSASAIAEEIKVRFNSHDKLVKALEEMIERYTDLVNCGDCGNWNPEEEKSVIAAREALAAAKGE